MKIDNSQKLTNNGGQEKILKWEQKIREHNIKVRKEIGLFLPPEISFSMQEVWESFFELLCMMYDWEILRKENVKKYLYDFFEIGKGQTDELIRKKKSLEEMWNEANNKIKDKKEVFKMFFYENLQEDVEHFYESLETDEERIKFLEMIYEGNFPPEIQEAVDDYEFSKLTPEEIEEIQRMAIAEATTKYQGKGGLNIGNKSGQVISAQQIADLIDGNEDGEVKKMRTLPDLSNIYSASLQNQTTNQTTNQPQTNYTQDINNNPNQDVVEIAPFASNKFEKLRNLPKSK